MLARSTKTVTCVSPSGACIVTEAVPLATDHPAGTLKAAPRGVARGMPALTICMLGVAALFGMNFWSAEGLLRHTLHRDYRPQRATRGKSERNQFSAQ
jgi:hypothetical protein